MQYLLSFLIFALFVSDWRHTVSSKFFDTRVPSVSTDIIELPCHAYCSLSRLHSDGINLLLNFSIYSIGRIDNPSCHICNHSTHDTFHLFLHCPATEFLHYFLVILSTTSNPETGELPGF